MSRRPSNAVGSVSDGAAAALRSLLASCQAQLPESCLAHVQNVHFRSSSPGGETIFFPCPLKEQEAVAAVKALEACLAAAIADLRYGREKRLIEVDVDKTACFLMSAYMATVDGMDKGNAAVQRRLPDSDLHKAQSVLYRRLSANLYETKTPGEYYHIHGSLEASTTLRMINLPPFNGNLTGYRECINTIEQAVTKFTVAELEAMNARDGQAGVPVLTRDQFGATPHGRVLTKLQPFSVKLLEDTTPPAPFPLSLGGSSSSDPPPQCLQGIKVLELCRVIAGPTMGRSLAAHGASVLKVTSPRLPDVPFFQVEVNTGKHTTSLHLRSAADRRAFEALLADADVVLDGYRPGVLDRLGYGTDFLARAARARGRGYVYVAEDCFGGTGVAGAEWSRRPGWQQIADCATGVAWEQGRFMGLAEPVVPPFPMSDYGTGAMGCAAALAGLLRRATRGGSWACRTSLCQYDLFLLSLGAYPRDVQDHVRRLHDPDFFDLRHGDSVDEVGKRAQRSMRRLYPHLFGDAMMHSAWSRGFKAVLRWPREAVTIRGLRVGHVRASRPNGFDAPTWAGWEVDDDVAEGC